MSLGEKAVIDAISIVIPCYYSGPNLPELVSQLREVVPTLCDDYEILLVNDGSTDGTWQAIQALAGEHAVVRGFNLMRNFGQHSALFVGIQEAQFPYIVTMDDDLQHPPTEIHKLLACLEQGYDLVYGVPEKEQHGLWRNLASVVTKKTIEYTFNVHLASDTSAFRAFRKELTATFTPAIGPFVDIDALLCWGTRSITAATTRRDPRKYGESNYTFGKLVRHAINMVTAFSVLPLRFASMVGFLFTLFGLGTFSYVMWIYLQYGVAVQGFTFTASIISLFSGAQLFSIGILGEYLARIHYRSMQYPSAIVRQTTPPLPPPSDS
jgi:undecaprenyl-phosphate 4-deoxy-4-formamido-L-arabinose transferase